MPESPLDIAVLIDDPELIRLAAVWGKLTAEQRANDNVIADAARISTARVGSIVHRGLINGIIFSDGAVNSYAQKYIGSLVAQHLKAKQK